MSAFSRSPAELGHVELGLAPPLRLAFALVIACASVSLAAWLGSPYWYWGVLLAVFIALRLSRTAAATRFYALLDSQPGLFADGNHFCGILGEWLVHGERILPHIEFVESLAAAHESSFGKPAIFDRRAPNGFRRWRLGDIQAIEYESDKPSIRLNFKPDTQSLALTDSKQRGRLVDQLVTAGSWQSESQPSWRFAPQIVSLLFFAVPLIAFGAFTFATAVGLVQVADLPLVKWGDVKGRGRGKGFIFLAAALSSAFLVLHDNVSALPRSAIGIVVVIAGLVFAYKCCVIKFQKVVWTNSQASRQSRDEFGE